MRVVFGGAEVKATFYLVDEDDCLVSTQVAEGRIGSLDLDTFAEARDGLLNVRDDLRRGYDCKEEGRNVCSN